MARNFEIPVFYRSPIIATLKAARRAEDRLKKDLAPSVLDLGEVVFKLGRHFGFCYGVENAIEIAYRAISENPDRRVFLLSEMIHNPQVNADLVERGVRFIMQTDGTRLIPLDDLRAEDIVIVPAFGTTVELFEELAHRPARLQYDLSFRREGLESLREFGRPGIHGGHSWAPPS